MKKKLTKKQRMAIAKESGSKGGRMLFESKGSKYFSKLAKKRWEKRGLLEV